MTTITLTKSPASSVKTDAVVIGVAKGPKGLVLAPGAEDADKAFKGKLAAVLAAVGATGVACEVTRLPGQDAVKATTLAAVGLGDQPKGRRQSYDAEAVRRAAGAAARELAGSRKVAVALPAGDAEEAEAVALGALLGAYGFLRHRQASRSEHRPPVEELVVVSEAARDKHVRAAVDRARVVAEAVNACRDLVNAPPSHLGPADLADAASAMAGEAGLDVEVLDEKALRVAGYGGILAVGQGSVRPPYLVRVAYRPRKAERHLALVGKGITFDSGGLSIKPTSGMETMKSDMGGAGAVLSATCAIARLEVPVSVTAWLPIAENMPSGSAQRPSDVITIYGGRTVEVDNTDAEGRLILADGIVRACEDGPDLLVDVATLTGHQVVALGNRTSAVMANGDDLAHQVHETARRAGEQVWPMPMPEELRKTLDSEVADISNMGERNGGMMVAAHFLRYFVADGVPWAHLDIAGPSFNSDNAYGFTPKGGTGAGVRTLVQVASDLADGRLEL